jgi:hypothetical protein
MSSLLCFAYPFEQTAHGLSLDSSMAAAAACEAFFASFSALAVSQQRLERLAQLLFELVRRAT